ncbi:hypothetical protein [Marinomonas atlantica]|uniref:hypothetical protein n=1 Tax=Marinomonas atlantica TaxID=1806668 RepID=UPI00082DEF86|nr:hypothetical protein [Marinomonas atlantica]
MKPFIQLLGAFLLISVFNFAALAFALTLAMLLPSTVDRSNKLAFQGIAFSIEIILMFSLKSLFIATQVYSL